MNAATNRKDPKSRSGLPDDERLLDYIEQVGTNRKGRRAVRFHLSLLAAHNRREQHIKTAIGSFKDLMRLFDGAVFPVGTDDLILVCKGANVLKIDQAVQKVRFLFGKDPLFEIDPAGGAEKFCTWYNLETEFDAFRRDAQNCVKTHKIRQSAGRRKAPAVQPPTPAEIQFTADDGTMSLAEYGNFETLLATADVSGLIRQQPICALTRDDPPQRVFDEVYVSIADLQNALAPNRNLAEDRWIFQRMTRTLDRRVLKALCSARSGITLKGISLNLNVATLLTPDFGAFDRSLPTGVRSSIMIELNLLDIFGDIGAYVYARNLAQERGYRICIDGLTHQTATFIDRDKLAADMVKIYWSPDIGADPAGNQAAALTHSVRSAGPARVVLCRCDDGTAVRAGLDLGIAMFQGRQIDGMLQEGSTIADAA